MKTIQKRFKLKEGQNIKREPKEPVIEIIGEGDRAYLWIGNDVQNNNFCFASLSGQKRLEKLAKAILEAISVK